MKTYPWHSVKQLVHHNDTDCNTGTNVVVYLRFTATKRGSTVLTWQAPQLLGASYIARFLAGAYGGTVTVR
jgi:hypothetical protein